MIAACSRFPQLLVRYIKEFVHGDFGRTKPNMGELLQTEADILELDVEVTLECSGFILTPL